MSCPVFVLSRLVGFKLEQGEGAMGRGKNKTKKNPNDKNKKKNRGRNSKRDVLPPRKINQKKTQSRGLVIH